MTDETNLAINHRFGYTGRELDEETKPAPTENPSDCKTCDDPPFNLYDRCSDLVRADLPFGGYKDKTVNTATTAMSNFRGKHPNIKDFSKLSPQKGGGDPMHSPRAKNPDGQAAHYKVFIESLYKQGIKRSAGSVGEVKCCIDGKPPRIESRFGILNIKDKVNNKFYNPG